MSAAKPSKAQEALQKRTQAQKAGQDLHDAPTPAEGLTASRLMTAQQLAERLQIPKGQVYRLTRAGQLPVVKVGRYFRYRTDQIDQWEQEGGTG